MKDINNALFKAFFDAVTALDIPCFEGEEPDDVKHQLYCVISDPISQDASTDNSSDTQTTIQVTFHSWEYKYNSSYSLNGYVGQFLQSILPTSTSVLDLSAFDLQMMNLSIQQDRIERYGEMGGKNYISRVLIFKSNIFVIS
jgi:hypothetical protein